MTRESGRDEQAVLLVAGLADLAASTLGSALGTVRGLLRRSDTAQLVEDAEQDLRARGRLALDRYAAVPPAHLEVLAQHVLSRRGAETSADTGTDRATATAAVPGDDD
ncbi:polyprenyl synthetase [Streptomyces sp. SKN60]|uniref:polyprenyl synthetase n=1 Tax=Streptomyces sp. SKN60 TaxID=2855506 RepID=UPI0022468BCD|nr:polyprenyl synthetase [Streptomyces sp. SKN60]MCX2180488.1 polyprenyl synthetase [Streptomyces sp. SKN60]